MANYYSDEESIDIYIPKDDNNDYGLIDCNINKIFSNFPIQINTNIIMENMNNLDEIIKNCCILYKSQDKNNSYIKYMLFKEKLNRHSIIFTIYNNSKSKNLYEILMMATENKITENTILYINDYIKIDKYYDLLKMLNVKLIIFEEEQYKDFNYSDYFNIIVKKISLSL